MPATHATDIQIPIGKPLTGPRPELHITHRGGTVNTTVIGDSYHDTDNMAAHVAARIRATVPTCTLHLSVSDSTPLAQAASVRVHMSQMKSALDAIESIVTERLHFAVEHKVASFPLREEYPLLLVVTDHISARFDRYRRDWEYLIRQFRHLGMAMLTTASDSREDKFGRSEFVRTPLMSGNRIHMRVAAALEEFRRTGVDVADLQASEGILTVGREKEQAKFAVPTDDPTKALAAHPDVVNRAEIARFNR